MRRSGVLLPVFSLPGKYGIGAFSKEAYEFVDFLKEAGQSYWQILPLGPTSYGDSPYQSFSTFAGNPYFISLETLIEEGLLTEAECEAADFGNSENYIDYYLLYKNRFTLLKKAFDRAELEADKDYSAFVKENEYWLEDYAFYMSVKKQFDDVGLDKWDDDIRLREEKAVAKYKKELGREIEFYKFLQYKFLQQWSKLKKYANDNGIKLIGDIPIYVSYDSADTWANPELFDFDKDRRPISVAGCPPDAFCDDGQLWGNPIYRWDYHKKTEFAWWKLRMQKCAQLYDVIRIDHFRGFDEFYSIPAEAETARTGEWKKGPGIDLFNALKPVLKDVQIIAEDLGFITDSVRKLVKDTGFPNMKVIEFAFDVNDKKNENDYLPHNYNQNAVVYTGTHDNETLMGWLKSISDKDIEKVKDYLNYDGDDYEKMVDLLVRLAHASVTDMCIIPLQDYLRLDNSARINRPSTLGNNWVFRVSKSLLTEEVAERINTLTVKFGRGGRIKEETRTVKWGVIGTAGIAKSCTIPGMQQANNCELYAIAGRNKEKVLEYQEAFGFEKAYCSYEELLADKEIEAVYIPLPNHLHYEWVMKAIEAGKNILCEKPLAPTEKEAKELYDAAKKKGVVLMEAFAYLHTPYIAALKKEIDDGKLGEISYIESAFLTSEHEPSNIRMRRECYGGSVYDLGCYCTSIITRLLGKEPWKVKALAEFTSEKIDIFTSALMLYENGVRAAFSCGMNLEYEEHRRMDRLYVHGSRGYIKSDVEFNEAGELSYTICTDGEVQVKTVSTEHNYKLEVEQLGRCISDGEERGVSEEFSLMNARVMDKVLEAIDYE